MAGEGPVGRERREEIADVLEQLAVLAVRQLGNRDISMTAASALGRLAREGPTRLTALAADEGVSRPAMTQLVQRLAKQGLMARVADPDDCRAVLVSITDAGRRLLAERRRDRVTRLSGLLAALPAEDQATLAAAVGSPAPALRRLVRAWQARVAAPRRPAGDGPSHVLSQPAHGAPSPRATARDCCTAEPMRLLSTRNSSRCSRRGTSASRSRTLAPR